MRRLRPLLLALGLTMIASPAYAGTVPISVTAQLAPVNTCSALAAPDPLWPLVVQAATNPAACDVQVAFTGVPVSRAADIVSAHAVARLFGFSGFEFGVLANDDSVAGSVGVPTSDNTVQSGESSVPLRTTGGSVTVVVRSANGSGDVWIGTAATRSVVVTVSDTVAPTVIGPVTAIPANVLAPANVSIAARLTDNGPTVTGATSTIGWGDGSAATSVATIAPLNPFASALTTTTAQHVYVTPGVHAITITARDSAGNLRTGTLGTLRAWGAPAPNQAPRATGALRRGSRLTCQPGGWTQIGGPTPLTYRWLRSGATITGVAARSYVLRNADRDKKIVCAVAGHNPAGGAREARSASRRFWVKPTLRSRPRVKGRAVVGSTLSCTAGSWRWSPQSFRYTWVRNGAATRNHAKRLKLRTGDAGKRLACRVTASNTAGHAAATSRSLAVKAKPKKAGGGGGGGGGNGGGCDPSYPGVCIPPPPPDLDCGDIPYRNFTVIGSDPHGFDGDNDGIGCES